MFISEKASPECLVPCLHVPSTVLFTITLRHYFSFIWIVYQIKRAINKYGEQYSEGNM